MMSIAPRSSRSAIRLPRTGIIPRIALAGVAMALAACGRPANPAPVAVDESSMGPRFVSTDTTADVPPVIRAWPAMGSVLRLSVWGADSAHAEAAIAAARAAVMRVDSLMSPDGARSELATANRRAGTDSATVLSPWTAEVVAAAMKMSAESGGALDVTDAPAMDAWGLSRGRGSVPSSSVRDSVAPLVGWQKVRWDAENRALRLPVRGMRVELGGMARGYAVDRAVRALREAGVEQGLVDLGGNYRVFGTPPVGPRWMLGLKDPRDEHNVFAAVEVDSGAIAMSGDYAHFWEAGGVRYSRIVDPRTREPARGVVSVTVIAATGVLADALARPLYVLGIEEGCRYAQRHPGAEAIWVRDTGEMEEMEDADDGLDPTIVVITDGLRGRLELLSEEPQTGRPKTCGEILAARP